MSEGDKAKEEDDFDAHAARFPEFMEVYTDMKEDQRAIARHWHSKGLHPDSEETMRFLSTLAMNRFQMHKGQEACLPFIFGLQTPQSGPYYKVRTDEPDYICGDCNSGKSVLMFSLAVREDRMILIIVHCEEKLRELEAEIGRMGLMERLEDNLFVRRCDEAEDFIRKNDKYTHMEANPGDPLESMRLARPDLARPLTDIFCDESDLYSKSKHAKLLINGFADGTLGKTAKVYYVSASPPGDNTNAINKETSVVNLLAADSDETNHIVMTQLVKWASEHPGKTAVAAFSNDVVVRPRDGAPKLKEWFVERVKNLIENGTPPWVQENLRRYLEKPLQNQCLSKDSSIYLTKQGSMRRGIDMDNARALFMAASIAEGEDAVAMTMHAIGRLARRGDMSNTHLTLVWPDTGKQFREARLKLEQSEFPNISFETPLRKILIRNLSPSVNEETLRTFANQYGRVLNAYTFVGKGKGKGKGKGMGMGCVFYATHDEAQFAKDLMHGVSCPQDSAKILKVEWAQF